MRRSPRHQIVSSRGASIHKQDWRESLLQIRNRKPETRPRWQQKVHLFSEDNLYVSGEQPLVQLFLDSTFDSTTMKIQDKESRRNIVYRERPIFSPEKKIVDDAKQKIVVDINCFNSLKVRLAASKASSISIATSGNLYKEECEQLKLELNKALVDIVCKSSSSSRVTP